MARARRRGIQVEGAEQLARMFRNMNDEAKDILDEACKNGGKIVLDAAKTKVKVVTGKLRNSLDLKKMKTKKDTNVAYKVYSKGVREGGVRYGFAQELGTSKMDAWPFLRPAHDENEQKVNEVISETIGDALDGVM